MGTYPMASPTMMSLAVQDSLMVMSRSCIVNSCWLILPYRVDLWETLDKGIRYDDIVSY